ncbi:MAG: hypothetical protein ACI319_02810 [Holdemanella porci]
MLYATHYEPEEFVELVANKNLKIFQRVYILDSSIAGIVYMCQDDENLYYLDRLFTTNEKKEKLESQDAYEIHQELYAKINLDESIRRGKI